MQMPRMNSDGLLPETLLGLGQQLIWDLGLTSQPLKKAHLFQLQGLEGKAHFTSVPVANEGITRK